MGEIWYNTLMPLAHITEVEKLLAKLYLFTWDETEGIRAQCKGATSDSLQNIIAVLKNALKAQEAMMTKIIEKDPEFPKKMDAFIKNEIHNLAEEHEKDEQSSAQKKFKELG